jgi:hypothetical protein
MVRQNKNHNWTGRLIHPEKDTGQDATLLYRSTEKEFEGYNFIKYVTAIDQYPDAHFDIVVVDGRARPACMRHAITKVKKSGLLVLDNSERRYYLGQVREPISGLFEPVVDGMAPVPYGEWFSRTTIWRKTR